MFISTLAFIPFALAASNWTVYTSNGPITGHTTGDVVEYLGIPYAEPPLGSLRFMPPQKLTRRRPYEAAHWGYDCPRLSSRTFNYTYLTAQAPAILAAFTGETGSLQSEDCLTLNIWSKPAQSRDQPVFVFFYGGRFAGGNTNTPFWNGRHFAAAEDIIIVTVNYRTNILGFPGSCTPGSSGCVQNLGLRDQRLAVAWIRDNIAAFGGDAQKIVIAGQSAGAVSVDYWAYAYKQDPIVAGLIMQSGSALSFPLNSPEHTTAAWRAVVRAVGCDGVDEIYCMQQKDWEDIRTAAAEVKPDNSTNTNPLRSTPAFYPVVDNETVFGDYPALNKKGLFAKLPILIGHNDKEEGYYALSSLSNGINALPTETEITDFHLSSFTCPIAAQANARTAHNIPIWQYRYFANWTNAQLYTSTNNNSNDSSALATLRGAYHGSELFMVFWTSGDVTGIEPSEAEKQMTQTIQRAWAVFCDQPRGGLSVEMQWPMFSRGELVRLGYRDSPTPDFVRADLYDGVCG